MPDVLSPDEVDRIAQLARLALTAEEKALYGAQLTRILDYASQIATLDTTGVPPMARVEEQSALERADELRPSLPRDEALRNAPESLAGLFVVPLTRG
jgi:aspartyl-tRNA(Asn)/glutamyl-tRNA(Gln) amidotransferase subunit C